MTEARQHRRYTKRQKATAVLAAELTSLSAASEQTGVPKSTLERWLSDPEMARLRLKTREEMAGDMTLLAALAAKRITERLGEFEPRDLVILLGVAVDKGQLLAGQATTRTEHRELVDGLDDHERAALRNVLDEVLAATEVKA